MNASYEKAVITLVNGEARHLLEDDLFELNMRGGMGALIVVTESLEGNEARIVIKYQRQHHKFIAGWIKARKGEYIDYVYVELVTQP